MAPKKKDKDKRKVTENVKRDVKSGKSKSKVSVCWLITATLAIFLSVAVLKIYVTYIAVPDMPELNMDTWWGPESKDQDTSIRPYKIAFTESMQENLRRKFESYRARNKISSLTESGNYGINSDALAQFVSDWLFKFTYRHRVRYLNQFEHFKTNVQGLDIHYVRVKPEVAANVKVVPILLLHGWPSSIKEFYDVIPLLTSEKAGYDFVFEVIAPSLPGFIFSQAPVKPGLSTYQIAIVMRNLMERLGFKQFYVHGGDIGHIIGSHMATIFPDQILGFHTSFPVNLSQLSYLAWIVGAIWPNMLGQVEKMYPLSDKLAFYLEESGYAHLQATKPDSIGIALQDSPVGLGAYIIDRILTFTDPSNRDLPDSGLSTFNTTDLIDNVMLYWSSGSITTSLRLFKENVKNSEAEEILSRIPTPVPTWGLRMKHELIHHPDFILRWKYPNLIGTTNLNFGGHYASFERPVEVADDIFRAVQEFLKYFKRK